MTLGTRRFLYIFFILLFLLITPLVLLLSSGYRFDFKKQNLVTTGGLVINSYPKGASVTLNGQAQKVPYLEKFFLIFKNIFGQRKYGGTTPSLFNNLRAGQYDIDIYKNNYQTWHKKLSIDNQNITFAEDIYLFLEHVKTENLITDKMDLIALSTDKSKLAWTTQIDDQFLVKITNLKNYKTQVFYQTSNPIQSLSWSLENNLLIAEQKNTEINYFVINFYRPQEIVDLQKFRITQSFLDPYGLSFNKLFWSTEDENILYGLNQGIIYQIDLYTLSIEKKINLFNLQTAGRQDVIYSNFIIQNENLIYLENSFGQLALKEVNLNDKQPNPQLITLLDKNGDYQFMDTHLDLITLFDKHNQQLRLINTQAKEDKIILKDEALYLSWNKNHTQLLYSNNFEINIFTPDTDLTQRYPNHQRQTINRYSQNLQYVNWHTSEKYLILSLDNNLQALELDNRNFQNSHQLLESTSIQQIFFTDDVDFLYLIGTINSKTGLFKIKIH
ncbi:MAG: hypothetical protein PHS07_00170 [Patescibacteria group bacterium]|nr:hypothetical protein [Patescibacteria group bacterium]